MDAKGLKCDSQGFVNVDPILGGYYGYEWPMLWPPKAPHFCEGYYDKGVIRCRICGRQM